MPEYIEREALLNYLDNLYDHMNAMSPQFYNGFMVARHHANDFSAADVAPVVRCKDCKYLMFSDFYGECRKGYMGIVSPDDFCSYGEQRESAKKEDK